MPAPYHLIETSADAFVERATMQIADVIRDAVEEKGSCVLGLSGGSTPRPIYEALAKEKDIDWWRVWMFLVDERFISSESPDSNLRLVRETLLRDSGTYEAEHLFAPHTDLSPEECVATYDRDLHRLLDEQGHPDLVILGMGDDGHIASLFPPLSPQAFGPTLAIHTQTDRFAVRDRISVTLPVLEEAAAKIFLLKGEAKKKTLDDMMRSMDDLHRWPAKALLEKPGTTVVLSL
jgi:6-phosphogluconolactonase